MYPLKVKISPPSYDPATITGTGSLKSRVKRDGAMRPLSKIFQNINRKRRGGSDGTAYIDTVNAELCDDFCPLRYFSFSQLLTVFLKFVVLSTQTQ